jgi:hypothetical protein
MLLGRFVELGSVVERLHQVQAVSSRCPVNRRLLKRLHVGWMLGLFAAAHPGARMDADSTILVLYVLVTGMIGGLLPTWPLSVTATVAFALGVLMLALVNTPEVGWDVAQFWIAIAVLVGALAHLVRRVALTIYRR